MPPAPPSRGNTVIAVVRATHRFVATKPDELSFEESSDLYVLNKDDANWWLCKCEDRQGLVPCTYVEENTAQIEAPLHEAAKRGNTEFVKELLENNVSVNSLDKAGNSPLHCAARGGHIKVTQLLLARNPALNCQNKLGDTPLHLASWGQPLCTSLTIIGGHPEIVSLLLMQQGIECTQVNKDSKTALQLSRSDECAAMISQFSYANEQASEDDS